MNYDPRLGRIVSQPPKNPSASGDGVILAMYINLPTRLRVHAVLPICRHAPEGAGTTRPYASPWLSAALATMILFTTAGARASEAPVPLRSHIRTFINGGRSDVFLAEHFDVFAWGNLNAKYRNPGAINLLYDYFGTMVPGDGNPKYEALLEYCAANGLTADDMEDMFLHTKNDVDYTLGEPAELDPPVTKTVPGWDPVNDANGDGYVDDDEFANRPNPDASARTKSEARIPIYYWGPPTDYRMNIGHPDYVQFLEGYAWYLVVDNEAYEAPFGWQTSGSARVVDQPFEGAHSCLIEVDGVNINLLNRQYVDLEPHTTYTIGAAIKTEDMTGFVKVYEYEFDGSEHIGEFIQVSTPTSPWQYYCSQFQTGSDVHGRITFRFYGGPGKAWFDEMYLAEGEFTGYVELLLQANLLDNGGFEASQTARYDGLFLDTLTEQPATQGNTEILEYPDVGQYAVDIRALLSALMTSLPSGTILAGNGWYSEPFIITGTEYEGWARILSSINTRKLDEITELDNQGIMQLIQYNPIYHETANPNRPDMYVEGVTLAQDQLYGLALYYLVHGQNTYFGYGCHGNYDLDMERWFDAVEYDVGQPLGPYTVLEEADSGYTEVTENILVNGDFELDADQDGNPDAWLIWEPVELDGQIQHDGAYSAKIHSETEINNINKQYVQLEPDTAYTLSGWIKTADVTGGAQIYPYEFDDCTACQGGGAWIAVTGTTDWTFYRRVFVTGSDVEGRINFRIYGTGTAWFDDIHLAEGVHGNGPIFAREFENALVLLSQFEMGADATVVYDLDGVCRRLDADGTLGPPLGMAAFRRGEGVIFAKVPPEDIPALSEWGMVLLALLVVGAGAVVLSRGRGLADCRDVRAR